MRKRLSVLGSTGSIGIGVLKIARALKEEFEITALAAKSNIDLLEIQAKEFHPQIVCVQDEKKALELKKRLPGFRVEGGESAILEAATWPAADLIISGICGFSGIKPTLAALEKGKQIRLANKEALVAAGELVMSLSKKYHLPIIPIDSELSGIYQCLEGDKAEDVHRLVITASGGPFLNASYEDLAKATVDEALRHPNYRMGAKVTIDSSTLMNKGLEMIESHFLFDIPFDRIEIVVHPEQKIHGFIEFIDGSLIAQMSEPNMLLPIQFAMTYPEKRKSPLPYFDITKQPMHFFKVDKEKFRCLELAYAAIQEGGSLPCFMNAANEILVERFLQREIQWVDISGKLEKLMVRHQVQKNITLESLCATDDEARKEALMS